MDAIHQIPIDQIDPQALLRDRIALDPAGLAALQHSIATEGLRLPVEVWRLSTPRPPHRYGLISGLRRLTACRALGHGTVAAFLRNPATIATAMAAMVSENEIRAQVSPWEKGRLIMATVWDGVFDTPDAAIAALYPALARQARGRLRSHATVVEALDGAFTAPETLTAARMERLAAAIRSGAEDLLRARLAPLGGLSADTQWNAIAPLLAERLAPADPEAAAGATRPRRLLRLKQGLVITREKCRMGYILRFTGPEARNGGLIDDVLDAVERMFQADQAPRS
ncbi:MAG: ParB/RepB/Spo0J family partition protein [Paracoccaceae bacterium]